MELIQIVNQKVPTIGKKATIRFTQSICPDCNMILDAEVFERDGKVFMTKTCPTHGECEELYLVLMKCTRSLAHIGWTERVHTLQTL